MCANEMLNSGSTSPVKTCLVTELKHPRPEEPACHSTQVPCNETLRIVAVTAVIVISSTFINVFPGFKCPPFFFF